MGFSTHCYELLGSIYRKSKACTAAGCDSLTACSTLFAATLQSQQPRRVKCYAFVCCQGSAKHCRAKVSYVHDHGGIVFFLKPCMFWGGRGGCVLQTVIASGLQSSLLGMLFLSYSLGMMLLVLFLTAIIPQISYVQARQEKILLVENLLLKNKKGRGASLVTGPR